MLKKITAYLLLSLVTQLYSQNKVSNAQKKAESYLEKVQENYKEGNYKLHKIYSDSLYNISKKNNLKALQVKALVNQAISLNIQTKYVEGITLYKKALAIAKTIPESKQAETVVLVNLGNIYNNVELYEKSIETMEKALKQATYMKNPNLIKMAALNGLSTSYSALNKEKKSLLYAQQVKKIGEETGNESIILTSLNHISSSYYKLGEYEKSIEIANRARKYKAFEKNTRVKAWILVNLGVANLKLEFYNKAEGYLKQALSIASEKNIEEIEMICYKNLAITYQKLNKTTAYLNAEKQHNKSRISFLKNQKKAITEELKAEIKAKEETVLAKEDTEALFSEQQKTTLWFSVFCVIGLGGLFWIYIKKNEEKSVTKETNEITEKIKETPEKYKNSSLSKEDRVSYQQKILKAIEEEKIYLNHDLTQANFAKKLSLSSHHLSEVFSFEFDKNFYQLINSYRIKEAKKILELPTNKDYKIIAVAYDAGFKSKTTFNRVFKEQTGYTPTEYRKKTNKIGSTL
ncbi:AraC family transcriptional regulator [Tenacibaculum singaporense]|uniref:AraC family transcriptional regulator n=1 Tax=Tenacibaculum singaporense TaxID=2358479 RepID=UPI000F6607A1|nr:AraC family transcriptional regulator [Tenacibaculum singaporense]RSC92512.1 AraC family transcriptional regulator [Tenacibaculum singaporense]